MHLLIATNNTGKLAELRAMLEGTKIHVISLADHPHVSEVAETGDTFQENARLKAAGYAAQTGLISIADDSGLEVAALGGRPGVLSARYGGLEAKYDQKMALLLAEMAHLGKDQRQARFVSSIGISDPDGNMLHQADGICEGHIAFEPRGENGFGYDPLFIPAGYNQTFGELPERVKREISHRARAFRLIIPFLRHFAAN